jgi:hypothetical protein
LKWTALLLIALAFSPILAGLGVAVNAHFIKPLDATTCQTSKSPVLLDPIDTDVPGGVCSVALEVNAA